MLPTEVGIFKHSKIGNWDYCITTRRLHPVSGSPNPAMQTGLRAAIATAVRGG
jgi:hypothetical protein